MHKTSDFSTSLSILIIFLFFPLYFGGFFCGVLFLFVFCSRPNACEVVSCALGLHFPTDSDAEHLFRYFLVICIYLLREISSQVLPPLFNQVIFCHWVAEVAYIFWMCVRAKSLQLCLTLWDPIDCSLPGSSAHGILHERKLEWVVVPSSRGSSWHKHWTRSPYISCLSLHLLHLYHESRLGSPYFGYQPLTLTSYFTTGEGNGNSLQYSCLENPMGRGAWRAVVHGVAESRTQLK